VTLITAALLAKTTPTGSWIMLLYLLPIAEAAAALNLAWSMGVAGMSIAGFLVAGGASRLSDLRYTYASFRLFFLALMASLIVSLGRELTNLYRERGIADYRTELAAEMHDGLQQYLSAISIRLELVRSMMDTDPIEAARLAVEQRHLARQAADELRVMINRLHSSSTGAGLAETIGQCLDLFRERCDANTDLIVTGDEIHLSPRVEHAMVRIIQEALNNAARHANPTKVQVQLASGTEEVTCSVSDDGCGIEEVSVPSPAGFQGGYGLSNMKSRAEAVGGHLEITSTPGSGTVVTVAVPARKDRT
jgi:signal transduction histidine kinase